MGRPKRQGATQATPFRTPSSDVPTTLEEFLGLQRSQDLLRFITCGSVDDGKSTLIGRLLWEAGHLYDDQLQILQSESEKYGTQGGNIDFALLLDGLAAEREQNITIDVAYRFFASRKRKFIIADTPGHEQYTRNMLTGASTADVAVLLVDATAGLLTQTRRHAFIVSLVGLRHIVLAINKMDLVDYRQDVATQISRRFTEFAVGLDFESITTIPMSALKGDNVVDRSPRTPWYRGPTLAGYLDAVAITRPSTGRFAFPVQRVSRLPAGSRGFAGTVSAGMIRVNDTVRVSASGQIAKVAEIITMDGSLQAAEQGQAVTLRLDRQIDASRGDVISLAQRPVEMTDQVEAKIVWMHQEAGLSGRTYDLKLATQWTSATITTIKYRINVDTRSREACSSLELNDIAVCTIATSRPIAYVPYAENRALGGFLLVDRFTHATVAAGMIRHTMRRSLNVHRQQLSIQREHREHLNGHRARVIWFTGLSGSGKSTLANALEIELHRRGTRTYILDGDNVRQGLNRDLGFTQADRVENIRRVAEVAKLFMDAGVVVITSFISPFTQERQAARELIGPENFLEIYVATPLEVCEERDNKGLYRSARAGSIPNMTGINSPYEAPEHPAYTVSWTRGVPDTVAELIALMNQLGEGGPAPRH